MKNDDTELLGAARAGDRHALETLLEHHHERIFRFGMKMCRHPEDAEDVLQDTLLTAARSISDFRGASSLTSWLYAIARSLCIKKRRKSKFAPRREASLEDGAAASLAAPDRAPDDEVYDKELRVALAEAIDALDPEQREVLLLRDVEGLRASEVSEVVGISVAAVKSKLHRARLRVRERLAPVLAEPTQSDCPDVLLLYSKHLEGEISAAVCSEMERHLESCDRCRDKCDSLKQTLSLCSRLPPSPVPDAVQERVRAAVREFLE